ncbi:MAG TPA: type II secretion system protein [Candidatus Limnocylindrales bacterium]|nr:type II secretion system protein [Candidatus Limnocylindrales bacterium]
MFITHKNNKGFTLIELLVVIGILSILLAITLIAINPARQFAQSNDTKRKSDVTAILNAIGQFAADNNGSLPGDNPVPANSEITTSPQLISSAESNLCAFLVTQYMAALPSDPTTGSPTGMIPQPCPAVYDTGYTVVKSALDNRVTITATGQITPIITATR